MFSACCCPYSRAVAFRPLSPLFSSFFTQNWIQRIDFLYLPKPRVNSPTVSLSFNWPRLCRWWLSKPPGTFFVFASFTVFSCAKQIHDRYRNKEKVLRGIVFESDTASSAKVTSTPNAANFQFPSDCAPWIPSRVTREELLMWQQHFLLLWGTVSKNKNIIFSWKHIQSISEK